MQEDYRLRGPNGDAPPGQGRPGLAPQPSPRGPLDQAERPAR